MKQKGGSVKESLMRTYQRLLEAFGPSGWWPARSAFEVMVGAILTQNTAWQNVTKAIENLKNKELLSPWILYQADVETVAQAVRPSGYFNQKAKRLVDFIAFFMENYQGEVDRMAQEDLMTVRENLLRIKGIGPETADSILLYALGKPIFVVDLYTQRIFSRHGLISEKLSYHELQAFFHENLPRDDVPLYKDFHGLIVKLGSTFCRKRPFCPSCPLYKASFLPLPGGLTPDEKKS